MRSILLLATFAVFGISHAFGQDFNNYKSIRSSGKVPEKFLTSSTEKYHKQIETKIGKTDKARDKKAKKTFYLQSSFYVDELLLSGKVMFNDPVSIYVSKVLDELLKDKKELRKKLEVYAVKSSSVNAFTTDNGVIIVTLGLLAQLENEAQLAYILGHEVTHFEKQHSVDEFVESQNIEKGRGMYRSASSSERMLAKSIYSKAKETEADERGLDLYLNSNYDLSSLEGVFDVLQYSHLPFDEVEYKKNFLETENFKLPDSYFLKDTKAIEDDEKDDELSTHPGAEKRKENIAGKIKGKSNAGRKAFIVSETEFSNVQKICRYELTNIYLHNRQYGEAFYNTYLLMQDNPESKYLKTSILKSLYGLTKYANADRLSEVLEDYNDIQGKSQQVYYLFDQMKDNEINVAAMVYAWDMKQQFPKDEEINALTSDIFHELVFNHYESRSSFYTTPRAKMLDSLNRQDSLSKLSDQIGSDGSKVKKPNKYSKIKKEKIKGDDEKDGNSESSAFVNFAFVDDLKDPEFIKEFDKNIKERKENENESQARKDRRNKEELKEKQRIEKDGYALGIEKVVFVNPFFYKLKGSNQEEMKLQLEASEKAQKNLDATISNCADLSGINYQIIDKKDLNANGADVFNDISIVNDFIHEKSEHEDLDFINYKTADIKALEQKYHTRYFAWTGVIALKEGSAFKPGYLLAAIIPYTWPFLAYYLLNPQNRTTYLYSVVYDIETGEAVATVTNEYKFRERQDILNSSIYDLMLQFKNKKRK